jgi:hypothetical protein
MPPLAQQLFSKVVIFKLYLAILGGQVITFQFGKIFAIPPGSRETLSP